MFIKLSTRVIAGFNTIALMASTSTLTGSLALVLTSIVITFVGASLIAYAATTNKVRIAPSVKPIVAEVKVQDVENKTYNGFGVHQIKT